jgi:large subunit ribosomal protein L21
MYAVIKTGGKQYKVAPGALVAVAKIAGEAGDTVAFEEVLLVGGENDTSLGSPLVSGATVAGEIVGQKRTAKILVFKKRRRQNSKRSRGHRQDETIVRITEILTDGKKPEMKKVEASAEEAPAKPKRAPRKAAAAAEGETEAAAKPARKPRAKAAKSEDKE